MEITTMQSMTCESTGMPFTAAFMRPILGSARIQAQGTSVSAAAQAAVRDRAEADLCLVDIERHVDAAGTPVIAVDAPIYKSVPSFADGVVRSASRSHPV
ncbi:hypothetical protein PZ938_09560 [Luteipulveratus sp. YIM 133132]|uniref:hypothetical protein n=1 Tax=Luteipulveratus flavus TaxID=3031728 RepID=UPI0023AF61FC|nr:hypothetical protein [Luteipulveratus sp. YIM 133132]MDE9365848.1 hypothetical protein [Luteipulveratus sp. YIM 133132]